MINNRRTICILGGTGTVGVTACKVLSKLGYSLRVSVRNIETIKDTGMYMAPNIQLFELDIDKESNIGKFFKGSDLVIGAIGPSADYSEKMLLEAMAENIPYVDPGGIHLIRKMRNSSMKGTAIVGSGIFPGLSGWMLSSVLKEAFNDDLIEMIIGGVYNFSKAAAIDYVEEIKSYKAGIPMACVRNGKILPAQKRSPLNLPTRISKLSILPYVTEEIQEIIQGKYMLNIDSYTAAPVSLFSIVNKAHCQKKDLVNALMGQKNSNQKAFIWVRQNKGNDSRCAIHVLYDGIDILGCALGGLSTWKLGNVAESYTTSMAGGGNRVISGIIGMVPVTFIVNTNVDRNDIDHPLHLYHRIELTFSTGRLCLVNTHGPVIWLPFLHMPRDEYGTLSINVEEEVNIPSGVTIGNVMLPSVKETFEQIWPDAVKKALEILFKQNRTEKMSMAQYQIYVSKLWSEICQKVGYMNIVDYDNFGDIKSIFYDLEKRHLIKKENDGIE